MSSARKVRSLFPLLFVLSLVPVAASASPTLGTKFVEIRAIRNGRWAISNQTPDQLLQLVSSIRASLGAPFNLYGFMDGQLDPNMPVGNTTLDDYLVQIQQAAGGEIIPYLNLGLLRKSVRKWSICL